MCPLSPITQTDLRGVKLFKRGKVRDIYDLGDELLIVATDRVSAFDCVLPDPIPSKGKVLTALSSFWFNCTRDTIPNHLITTSLKDYPPDLQQFKDILEGRSMLVKRSEVIKIECVVRGYLAGSAYGEYKSYGSICGIRLPRDLREADPLPEPIFTPATKASSGHDINITREKMRKLIGDELSEKLAEISLEIYKRASELLKTRGIMVSDTKFEFGFLNGEVILIDEILTPDSSRFWSAEEYTPGQHQKSFDKQFLRDYLETLDWDKTPPAPHLPPHIIRKTSERYLEAYRRITGEKLGI
jgi:phosphoribosylaminoimidazole-succinocarboxamide synthase